MTGEEGRSSAPPTPPTRGTGVLRRLWGLDEPARLGRPAKLGVRRVVQAAVELADRDGLPGVTLPKIAAALGYTTMSLYRHVGSKDELWMLLADAGLGPAPTIRALRWRDGLGEWARAERAVYLRRPWLTRLPISGPPSGPNQIAWMDAALRALRDTELGYPAKVGVLMVVSGHVRQSVMLSTDLAAGRLLGLNNERDYGRSLAEVVDPKRFPEAAKLFSSTVFDGLGDPAPDADPAARGEQDFQFGLEMILDGVERAVSLTTRSD